MKKILLMTLATGGGHNYAAGSLKNELQKAGFQAELVDPFRSGDRLLNLLVAGGYNTMAKSSPRLYGKIYRLAEREEANEMVINLVKRKGSRNLLALIEKHQPDLIVSTHPVLTYLLGAAKEEGKLSVPVMAVVTDFMGHYTYMAYHGQIDAYITGSARTKRDLVERGAPEQKVFAYGIPIREEFYLPRAQRKEGDLFTILIMGGSMGLKIMEKVIAQVMERPEKLRIVAVCGSNEAMKGNLIREYEGREKEYNKEIVIYGFTREVARLMDEADLMITKPGGLTVSEAIAKRMPLLIPYMIPGQEEENANILEEAGAAIRVEKVSEVGPVLGRLMQNPIFLETMQANMGHLAATHSLEAVVEKARELAFQEERPGGPRPVDVLILTGGFSRGYNDAADSLEEQLTRAGWQVEKLGLLQKMAPSLHRKMKRSYLRLMQNGEVVYDLMGLARKLRPNFFDELGLRVYLPLFSRYVRPYSPRILVSFYYPWVFLGAHYKRIVDPGLKLAVFVPEIPEDRKSVHREIDAYLVPHADVQEKLVKMGADPEKVFRASFPMPQKGNVEQSRAFLQTLVGENESKPVLVLLGEEGAWLPRDETFYRWLADSGYRTIVLTGENRGLKKMISQDSYPQITALQSVDDLSDLIGAADLIVGRPYTITTFEALLADTPFVAYLPAGQGEQVGSQNAAWKVTSVEELQDLLLQWIKQPDFRKALALKTSNRRMEYRREDTYAAIIGDLLSLGVGGIDQGTAQGTAQVEPEGK